MNKQAFLAALAAGLADFDEDERRGILEFHAEAIDDRVEDGMGESEAVAALGPVAAILRELRDNRPAPAAQAGAPCESESAAAETGAGRCGTGRHLPAAQADAPCESESAAAETGARCKSERAEAETDARCESERDAEEAADAERRERKLRLPAADGPKPADADCRLTPTPAAHAGMEKRIAEGGTGEGEHVHGGRGGAATVWHGGDPGGSRRVFRCAAEKVVVCESDAAVILLPGRAGEVALTRSGDENVAYEVSAAAGVLTIVKRDERPWYQKLFDWMRARTLTVEVPEGCALEARSVNGDLSATGLRVASLALDTQNAAVRVADCAVEGTLNAVTRNGAFVARKVRAHSLTAETSNSRMLAQDVRVGALSLTNGNGGLRLEGVTAGEAALATSNGGIELRDVAAMRLSASTSNARIAFAELRAAESLELSTSNGPIRGELPGTLADYAVDSGTSNAANALPARSDGAIRLCAHTSNGAIDVRFAGGNLPAGIDIHPNVV